MDSFWKIVRAYQNEPTVDTETDLPHAEIHLLDGGHFLLESALTEVARRIRDFLARRLPAGSG